MSTADFTFERARRTAAPGQFAGRMLALLGAPRLLLGGIAAYLLPLFLLPVLFFNGAQFDDTEQLFFAQEWQAGYGFRNPPLFTWIVVLAQYVLGPTLLTISLVKAVLTWSVFALLLWTGRAIGLSAVMAGLAALCAFGLFHLSAEAATRYSNSILLLPACLAAVWCFVRLDRRDDWSAYALLGVVAGLGMLSKYNFGLLLLALIGAGLFDARLRTRILSVRFLLVPLIAAALYAPHGLWQIENLALFSNSVSRRFFAAGNESPLSVSITALFEVATAAAFASLPLAALFAILLPRALYAQPGGGDPARWRRFIGLSLALVIALSACLALGTGAGRINTRYLFILIPLPLYLIARLQTADVEPRALARFAVALLVMAALAPLWIFAGYVYGANSKIAGKANVPYAALAERLQQAGFSSGTLIGDGNPYDLAGGLRPHLPQARILSTLHPEFAPAARSRRGQCLLLWSLDARGDPQLGRRRVLAMLADPPHAGETPPATIELPVGLAPERIVRFQYILLPDGSGACA